MASISTINSLDDSTIKNNDWLVCAKWLNNCKCLPGYIQQKLLQNQLSLTEFANSLRDGEILCNLANYLIPGSIDVTKINKRARTSQALCLMNIRLFLDACNSPDIFDIDKSDLFDERMLYELDLPLVIRALSNLSKSKASTRKGCGSFSLGNEDNNLKSSTSYDSESVFSNIYDQITLFESEDYIYTDDSFLIEDQSIDKDKNQSKDLQYWITNMDNSRKVSGTPMKRDYVMKELLNTERNYVEQLEILTNDFLRPISQVLNEEDRKCVCINIESLLVLHKRLYTDLFNACKGNRGRTERICHVFDNVKIDIMQEYAVYFSNINQSKAKCDFLADPKQNGYASEYRKKLNECQMKNTELKLGLKDQLIIPYQRVLKYHLLFKELFSATDTEHSAKELIEITKESMCEVGAFLNECHGDQDNLTKIEKIMTQMAVEINLKEFGRHIKDDRFQMKSAENCEVIARNNTFFLFERALIICNSKGKLYQYKEVLYINDFIIQDPLDKTNEITNTSSLAVYDSDRNKVIYMFCFKNQEQKLAWKESFNKAKSINEPKGQRNNGHIFLYTNFMNQIVRCCVCTKYLVGIFYQGYKCELCSQIVHKDCLIKTSLCIPTPHSSSIKSELPKKVDKNNRQSFSILINPPTRRPITVSKSSSLFCVQAVYSYDGRPNPPRWPVLKFAAGDFILVTDDDDDCWFRGSLVNTKNIQPQRIVNNEGYFPTSYVKSYYGDQRYLHFKTNEKLILLEDYSWFGQVDRETAIIILNRIPDSAFKALFMVRKRQKNNYAISIKFNGIIKHLIIYESQPLNDPIFVDSFESDKKGSQRYFLNNDRSFNSVADLVKYYCMNSLEEAFSEVKTTLGTAYREALPASISYAVAFYEYDPTNIPMNQGQQIKLFKGHHYNVLEKELNGWWRVYNSDGLIGYVPGEYLVEIN